MEELKKLLQMVDRSYDELFKRRRPTRSGTEIDRICLSQVRERALDLQFACQQLQSFDPNFMLMQLHELSELLFKVQAGKLDGDIATAMLMEAEEQGYSVGEYDEHEGAV